MTTPEIIEKIELLIDQALNYRYSAQVKPIAFVSTYSATAIANRQKSATIFLQLGRHDLSFRYFSYRLPQTRIYYSEYQNIHLTVKVIEFFESAIVIFCPIDQQEKYHAIISNRPDPLQIRSTINFRQEQDSGRDFYFESPAILWWSHSPELNDLGNIPQFIQTAIKIEHEIHPLSQLTCSNEGFLSAVDERWARLNLIDQNRLVIAASFFRNRLSDFIWLQEVYLHLGWFNELAEFYQKTARDYSATLTADDKRLLGDCHTRFSQAANLSGYTHEANSFRQIQPTANSTPFSFLQSLLHFGDIESTDLSERLQTFWESIHLPLMNLKIQDQLAENPDEFIAFAMLAVSNKFWWADEMIDRIDYFLTEPSRSLFDMLVHLKKHINLSFRQSGLAFSRMKEFAAVQSLDFFPTRLAFKCTRHSKKELTVFQSGQILDLRIDKAVQVNFNRATSTIIIDPLLYQPPLTTLDFHRLQIRIDDFNLSAPMVWAAMVIEFNGARLRFLRKKRRMQVSIKKGRSAQRLFIENREIDWTSQPQQKLNLPLERRKSIYRVGIFNEHGSALQAVGAHLQQITIKGAALDQTGVLVDMFRVSVNNAKRSEEISGAHGYLNTSAFPKNAPVNLHFYARNCEMTSLNLPWESGFLDKLRYTPAEILNYLCHVYLETYSDTSKKKILRIFHEEVGFNPNIHRISDLQANQHHFIFLIKNNNEDEATSAANLPQLVKTLQNSSVKVLECSLDNLSWVLRGLKRAGAAK